MPTSANGGPAVIEGRVVHKVSNALKIAFSDGPGDPFAVGVQGAADGKGKRLGILFGFKNGGAGNHVVTYQDGSTLGVTSKSGAPSVFTHKDGSVLATVNRGPTSSAVFADGTEALQFVPDPTEAKTVELFRLLVNTPGGVQLGRLDVIRRASGWESATSVVNAAVNTAIWWDRPGQPLPVPLLGTRLTLEQPVTGVLRDVLVGACVDIALGLRPYVAEMS